MPARPRPADSQPDPRTIRAIALALVARRDYTSAELESKLIDKGYEPGLVAGVIEDFVAQRILDDRRTAAAHVRRAAAIKGRGRVRIGRELTSRGVSRDIIDEVLSEVARDDELASLRKILSRKRWPANPSRLERQRMYRHLLGRGFPTDLISRALGSAGEDDAD